MDYFIAREDQEYGPYTLADLQRYVASGDVLLTDMARSESITELLPVSQIVGNIPVPIAPTYVPAGPAMPEFADPPNLHWGLVLLFYVFTCTLFGAAWGLVQAAWLKKVSPHSKALFYYIGADAVLLGVLVVSIVAAQSHVPNPASGVLNLISWIASLVARYNLRSSLEEHFNTAEPLGLGLSGVMTFFFGPIYFQYHLNDIVRRKNAARMGMFSA